MAYSLSNICTKNYWNRTTIAEIIIGGWVVSFLRHSVYWSLLVMAALHGRWGHYIYGRPVYAADADIIFLSCGFFLLFYSSPNLSGRRLDVYHTSTHGVALVRI